MLPLFLSSLTKPTSFEEKAFTHLGEQKVANNWCKSGFLLSLDASKSIAQWILQWMNFWA